MENETWRPIPGFEGYDVSDRGRVRSYRARKKGRGQNGWYIADKPHRILRPSTDPNGYRGVGLMDEGGNALYVRVSHLVMLAFVGPRPEGQEVCHNDGNPANNSRGNLRYDTPSGNKKDMALHGSWGLSPEDIVDIRERRVGGELLIKIAKDYSSSATRIKDICHGKTYMRAGGPTIEPFQINANRKLSDSDVIKIRELRSDTDLSLSKIAATFGIHPSTVSKIGGGTRRAGVADNKL